MSEIVNLFDPEGVIVWPGAVHVKQYPWENVGSMTVAEAAVSSAERSQTSMETTFAAAGKSVIYTPRDGQVAVTFRIRTDGNADDSNVLDMFWAAADDVVGERIYSRNARLTCLQGTQLHTGSIFFNDSIVESLNSWITVPKAVQPSSADNHISQYVLNVHGIERFAFVLTTKDGNTTTVYVDARRL